MTKNGHVDRFLEDAEEQSQVHLWVQSSPPLSLPSFSPSLFSIWRSVTADLSRVHSQTPDSHRRVRLFYWIQKSWTCALGLKRKMFFWGIRKRKQNSFQVHNDREDKCTLSKATKLIMHTAEQVAQHSVHWSFPYTRPAHHFPGEPRFQQTSIVWFYQYRNS